MAVSLNRVVSVLGENVTIENTYNCVGYVEGNKHHINFTVEVYKDNSKSVKLDEKLYGFTPDTSERALEITTQCYLSLKEKDEYADAVDC